MEAGAAPEMRPESSSPALGQHRSQHQPRRHLEPLQRIASRRGHGDQQHDVPHTANLTKRHDDTVFRWPQPGDDGGQRRHQEEQPDALRNGHPPHVGLGAAGQQQRQRQRAWQAGEQGGGRIPPAAPDVIGGAGPGHGHHGEAEEGDGQRPVDGAVHRVPRHRRAGLDAEEDEGHGAQPVRHADLHLREHGHDCRHHAPRQPGRGDPERPKGQSAGKADGKACGRVTHRAPSARRRRIRRSHARPRPSSHSWAGAPSAWHRA